MSWYQSAYRRGVIDMHITAAGLEVPGTDHQPNHVAVCKAGIPMVESLRGLEALGEEHHFAILLPLPMEGLDASPVRVIAIKREGLLERLEGLR